MLLKLTYSLKVNTTIQSTKIMPVSTILEMKTLTNCAHFQQDAD